MIQATNSYSPSQYLKSGEKMKHSLADLPFSESSLSVFSCRILRPHSARLLSLVDNYSKIKCFGSALAYELNISDVDISVFGRISDSDM